MTEFISLTCPNCGGKLEITPDLDQFSCAHCGNEHLVIRKGGTVSLQPVLESLKGIERGTDRTASELAIARLNKKIFELQALMQEKETEYEGKRWETSNRVAVISIATGILATIIGGGQNFDFLILIGATLVIIGVLSFFARKTLNEAQMTRENEIAKIKTSLDEKYRELNYHRELLRM